MYVYIYIAVLVSFAQRAFLLLLLLLSNENESKSVLTPGASPDLPPVTRPPHRPRSLTATALQSAAAAETLKTGAPTGPGRRPGGRFIFCFVPKKEEVAPGELWRCGVCPKTRGGVVARGVMFLKVQISAG